MAAIGTLHQHSDIRTVLMSRRESSVQLHQERKELSRVVENPF